MNSDESKDKEAITERSDLKTKTTKNNRNASETDNSSEKKQDKEAEEAIVTGMAFVGTIALKLKKVKNKLNKFWAVKRNRYILLASSIFILLGLFAYPPTRYRVLNTLGVKASVKLTTLDSETKLPLKKVKVVIDDKESYSDAAGQVIINGLTLGKKAVQVAKPGYAQVDFEVRIELGRNDLGSVELVPTGTKLVFMVTDWISGDPIAGAEAVYQDSSAFADESGRISLVIPPIENEKINVTIYSEGYFESNVEVNISETAAEHKVQLLVYGWHSFVSKRSGKLDLYRSKFDGSEQELVLAGTGYEDALIYRYSPAPDNLSVAVTSTRDNIRNDDGYMLSGLYVVNLEDKQSQRIDLSEGIFIHGWIGPSLIYTTQKAGESGASPNRTQLKSYDASSGVTKVLASSNYFRGVLVAAKKVYFAPFASFKQQDPKPGLYVVNADGSEYKTITLGEVTTIVRLSPDQAVVETVDSSSGWKSYWQQINLLTQELTALDGRPAEFASVPRNRFVENFDGSKVAWVDQADGKKKVITIANYDGSDSKKVWMQTGIDAIVSWVDDKGITFRVNTDLESSDYIVAAKANATPKKITDVFAQRETYFFGY